MFYLDCDRYTLYAGRFIASNSELFQDQRANKGLRELMQRKKIDDLYIDLTMANIDEFNLQRTALHEIESLVKYVRRNFEFALHIICNNHLFLFLGLTNYKATNSIC